MYSLLPALTALVFLGLGLYVVKRKGLTGISASFLLLSVTTFFWQFTWAFLFQVEDPELAGVLVKVGYFFILFLPTSIYQFLVEISDSRKERPYVYASYGVAMVFSFLLLTTDLLVSGFYEYFWGYYPQAGPLHILHVIQTTLVVSRGLYITWEKQREAVDYQRSRLRYCVAAMLIYFLAAVDYLCNYGFEFYPPGVVFVLISFSIMTFAIVRYGLMNNPAALAASMAHEMRTPLATIQMQVEFIARYLPELLRGYQIAVDSRLCESGISKEHYEEIQEMTRNINKEISQSNTIIDIALASARTDLHSRYEHDDHSMAECVTDAVESFPFNSNETEKVTVNDESDFTFLGSDTLMKYVIYNLIKNALYAIRSAGYGHIEITLEAGNERNRLFFSDTGPGILPDVVPHVFDEFFSTRNEGSGSGMGLAFCRRVITGFGGTIECSSRPGKKTLFTITLPEVGSREKREERKGPRLP